MRRILLLMALTLFGATASAACITNQEKALLKLQAFLYGSVKLFVNHSQLGLNTPVEEIHAATAQSIAELNADGPVVTLTWSWMPYNVSGFEVFATAAGVEELHTHNYCFGKID